MLDTITMISLQAYFSYTEVPLRCVSTSGRNDPEEEFNLLQAAYVTKPGYDLADLMGVATEDDVLFAAFSSDEDSRGG